MKSSTADQAGVVQPRPGAVAIAGCGRGHGGRTEASVRQDCMEHTGTSPQAVDAAAGQRPRRTYGLHAEVRLGANDARDGTGAKLAQGHLHLEPIAVLVWIKKHKESRKEKKKVQDSPFSWENPTATSRRALAISCSPQMRATDSL